MFRRILFLSGVVCLAFVLVCSKEDNPTDYTKISNIEFSRHVQPLLNANCTGCHAGAAPAAGLSLESWSSLIKGSDFGEAVIPFDSENSIMIEMMTKLSGGVHPTEKGEDALTSDGIAFLARWIDQGARNDAGDVPYEDSQNILYVCNQMEAIVSILDVDAKVVIRNVHLTDLGVPANSKPHHIALSPDGQNWFVSLIDNQVNKILKFNMANELLGEVVTDVPAMLAYHPTDDVLYSSRFMDPQVPLQSIFALNANTMAPINQSGLTDGTIVLPSFVPHAMALSMTGDKVFTASLSENTVMIVDHATKSYEESIPLGDGKTPLQLSISPDNSTIFVSCIGSDEIAVIDVAARQVVDFIPVGGVQPWHSVSSSDGSKLYAGNLGSNNFTVVDVQTRTAQVFGAGDGSDGLAQSHGIALSKDGQVLFIANRNVSGAYVPRHNFGDNSNVGTVVVVNTASNQVVKTIEVENFASGMAIRSN